MAKDRVVAEDANALSEASCLRALPAFARRKVSDLRPSVASWQKMLVCRAKPLATCGNMDIAMCSITDAIYARIIAHAEKDAPDECCGLLAGAAGRITAVYPIQNLSSDDPRIADLNIPPDRRVRYMMDPRGQLSAMKQMRAEGLTMMGIYHSHPHSPAYPSATDVRLAFYSDLLYVIVSLMKPAPIMRAFWIVDQNITEEAMDILSPSPLETGLKS